MGIRGLHVVLRRSDAGPLGGHRRGRLSEAVGTGDAACGIEPGTQTAECGGIQLRCMDQVLPPGREYAERGVQLLREGITGGTLSGSADPGEDPGPAFAG